MNNLGPLKLRTLQAAYGEDVHKDYGSEQSGDDGSREEYSAHVPLNAGIAADGEFVVTGADSTAIVVSVVAVILTSRRATCAVTVGKASASKVAFNIADCLRVANHSCLPGVLDKLANVSVILVVNNERGYDGDEDEDSQNDQGHENVDDSESDTDAFSRETNECSDRGENEKGTCNDGADANVEDELEEVAARILEVDGSRVICYLEPDADANEGTSSQKKGDGNDGMEDANAAVLLIFGHCESGDRRQSMK